jgi:hypothetical protein
MNRSVSVAAGVVCVAALHAQAPTLSLPSTSDFRDQQAASIKAAVKSAYQREFSRVIEHPAIYNNSKDCRGEGHLTTTAYLRNGENTILLSMYMSRDAAEVIRKTETTVGVLPAGTIRTLVALIRYPETVGADGVALLARAQQEINEQHIAFARSRGYVEPVVVFRSTNLELDASRVGDPRNPASIRAAAEQEGVAPRDFDLLMAIDINPRTTAGGFSLPDRFIYMGNFSAWKTELTAHQWSSVARAAYHHEVAHHWGWPGTHDWAASCGANPTEYAPFIVPPVLLGWEDLDGDHVPDIWRVFSGR